MVLLWNAIFNESISSTGNPRWRPEKGKCLVVNGHFRGNILYTPNIELHITQKHNSNDYVHVCEVSESNAIDIYATQTQKKLEVAIMTDKMEDYFIVGPITAIGYISTTVCLPLTTTPDHQMSTFVRPAQPIEIFGTVSTSLVPQSSGDFHENFYGDHPRETPPSGVGDKDARRVAKYSDFRPVEGYISQTVQDKR